MGNLANQNGFGQPNAEIGWKMVSGRLSFLALLHVCVCHSVTLHVYVYLVSELQNATWVCVFIYQSFLSKIAYQNYALFNFSFDHEVLVHQTLT